MAIAKSGLRDTRSAARSLRFLTRSACSSLSMPATHSVHRRVSNARKFSSSYQPFACRRHLDIVPHCPPQAFGYSDLLYQVSLNGMAYVSAVGIETYFFLSWLGGLAFNQFRKNHSMERYRFEVIEEAKKHPRNQPIGNPSTISPRRNRADAPRPASRARGHCARRATSPASLAAAWRRAE